MGHFLVHFLGYSLNLSWYNEEMEECAAGYAAYVVELLETAKQTCTDPVVMIEQRVNFSRWVQDGFGTADCIVIADGVMNICDYKYGKGVEVSAVANPQMMLYALGALEIFDDIYDIDTVRMTIFQPRKSNVSAYEMEKADLLQWADTELTQKAKLAYEGQGDFHCGEWCRFCKAKAECRERAEANMALARYDFQTPALLDDEEIADILGKVDALTAWASDVKERPSAGYQRQGLERMEIGRRPFQPKVHQRCCCCCHRGERGLRSLRAESPRYHCNAEDARQIPF